MNLREQLQFGVYATVIVVTLSLAIALSLPPALEMGWVTVLLNGMVPTQMVMTLFWRSEHPAAIKHLSQPWRGLILSGLTLIVGFLVATVAVLILGGGHPEPTPFVIMPLIMTIPITLAQIVLFEAWPFSQFTKSRIWQGVWLLVATYVTAGLIDIVFFDFSFLREAPFYRQELDPHGMFMAMSALTVLVSSVSAVLALKLLDFWPMQKLCALIPACSQQPWRGLILSTVVVTLVACLWLGFVKVGGMDIVTFQTRVCVCMIFGLFIVLVMFRGAPFVHFPQPIRGLVLIAGAAMLAALMYELYRSGLSAFHALKSGPPAYAQELWMSSAMLAITFLAMVTFADYFDFWPLIRNRMQPLD